MAFIKLDRKFFAHDFWNEEREYSRAEAWLDMIQIARFETKQEIIQNKIIVIQRGEFPASRRFLEKRWNWGNSKVTTFLKMLNSSQMISQRANQGQTIIKLLKYDCYNVKQTTAEPQPNHNRTANRTTTEPPTEPQPNHQPNHNQTAPKPVKQSGNEDNRTATEPVTEPQPNHNQTVNRTTIEPQTEPNKRSKEYKEVKNKKEREVEFRDNAFTECSPPEDLFSEFEKFCDYWVENGPRAKKLRFEKETTWNLKRRWSRWLSNKATWEKRKKVPPKKEKIESHEARIGRQTASDIEANADPREWGFGNA